MLSCMKTKLGMTVLGPKGQVLRLLDGDPVFRAARDLLSQARPDEQTWQLLQDLVANPLKVLVDWCSRFKVTLKDEGAIIRLNDTGLAREQWVPLLARTQAAGGNPVHLLAFAGKLGALGSNAQVGSVALHLRSTGLQTALLRKVFLPEAARSGDVVTESSTGSHPFLVSFDEFTVLPSGIVEPRKGKVLSKVTDMWEADDILQQPFILGANKTYCCEEGSVDGWLEDNSFDSLAAARVNAKAIQDFGSEARIINRITGETVSMH